MLARAILTTVPSHARTLRVTPLKCIYTSVSYIQVGLLALLAPLLEMGFEREACRRRANPDPNPNPNPNLNPNAGVKKSTSQKNHRVGSLGKASTAAKKASHAQ